MRETDEAMIKVLMTGVSNIGKAGVATIAFRLGQAMDSEKISLGYLAQRGISDVKYIDLIEDGGGRVHIMPPVKGNKLVKLIKTIQWVSLTAKENTYDIVHINADTAYLAAIYMKIFQSNGMTKMIVHSHSTMVDENNKVLRSIKIFLHCLCKRYIRKNAHLKLACSSMAAKWMFDKDQVTVVPNGIDCKQFEFDSVKRDEYRKEMKLGGKFVICCVGRLAYPKNSFFTIDIFREILKEERNSILLFIGDGELRGEIERYIESNGLGKKVLLLGNRETFLDCFRLVTCFCCPQDSKGLELYISRRRHLVCLCLRLTRCLKKHLLQIQCSGIHLMIRQSCGHRQYYSIRMMLEKVRKKWLRLKNMTFIRLQNYCKVSIYG